MYQKRIEIQGKENCAAVAWMLGGELPVNQSAVRVVEAT